MNSAPCGSSRVAVRTTPPPRSVGGETTLAPSFTACSTTSSVLLTVKVTVQRGCTRGVGNGRHPADRVTEPLGDPRLGVPALDVRIPDRQEVAVAGAAPHEAVAVRVAATEVDRVRLPAEDRTVERLRALGVGGGEVAGVPRARCVDQLRTVTVPGLPEANGGAVGVGEGSPPAGGGAGRSDVDWRNEDVGAERHRLRRRGVGVDDAHVRVPGRWARHAGRRCRDRRDVEAVPAGDEVLVASRRELVLELPAEDPTVELGRRLGIGLLGVDQARDAGRVLGAVENRSVVMRHHDGRSGHLVARLRRRDCAGIGRAADGVRTRGRRAGSVLGCTSETSARVDRSSSCTAGRTSITTICSRRWIDSPIRFGLIYDDQHGRGRSAEGCGPEDVSVSSDVRTSTASKPPRVGTRRPPRSLVWGGVLAMEYATRHPEQCPA